jgi:hypothetical protein
MFIYIYFDSNLQLIIYFKFIFYIIKFISAINKLYYIKLNFGELKDKSFIIK